MILDLLEQLTDTVRLAARSAFDAQLAAVSFQYPPRPELGDLALTAPFDLAKVLRRKPREIAAHLASALAGQGPIARAEVAGGGYVNLFLDRAACARRFVEASVAPRPVRPRPATVIVEHTSINPNKAAHIGHLRNAVLGDTFVRLLRSRGYRTGVQNYIDDTGVQVADVVVGFQHVEGQSLAEVEALAGRFDYHCWDLYARVGDFYAADPQNKALQARTLHAIEAGDNDTARLAEHVARRIVDAHLTTMERIDVRYDLLAHESDILRLHFWDRAFERLKQTGAIRLEADGKMAGCWVLSMGTAPGEDGADAASGDTLSARAKRDSLAPGRKSDDASSRGGLPSAGDARRMDEAGAPSETTSDLAGRDSLAPGRKSDDASSRGGLPSAGDARRIDEDKIIVRSNGTVTYTGKDIAYQLWKLGKLERDFRYRRRRVYPDGHELWSSTSATGESGAPAFGHADLVYNVIDVGQSYPQRVVKAGVAAVGFPEAAEGSHHLAYEKVVLSPATARALGYDVSSDEAVVKVSGRKGLGVKADDLIDALFAKAREEITTRDPERPAEERDRAAQAIAVGALRYFLLRYGRNKIITFDLDEALAFVGETGPYVQNSLVRARNIFAKLQAQGHDVAALLQRSEDLDLGALLQGEEGDEVWALLLLVARSEDVCEQALRAQEPSLVARHAFTLAQAFHAYYQKPRYSLLYAEDDVQRAFRTRLVDVFVRQMQVLCELLGIPVPERM